MPNIATAYVTLVPTMRGSENKIQKELSRIDGRSAGRKVGTEFAQGAEGPIGNLRGSFRRLAVYAGGVLASIGLGSLVAEASRASDAMYKFEQTLQFAGLDDSKIAQLSASTKEYAARTVYDLQDIQGITSQLAANSVKDFELIAEAAGNLNAVAGGNKETYKSLGMVLTQTAGLGKLTTENFNQFAEALGGASGKLQEQLAKNGAFVGNFREAMEKGEISAEEFNQAIIDLGMTDIAKEAATSTETFEGALGNLKATAVDGIAAIIDKVKPGLIEIVNGLTALLEPALKSVEEVLNALTTTYSETGSLTKAFGAAIGALPAPLKAAGGALTFLVAGLTAMKFASVGGFLAKGLQTISNSVGKIADKAKPAGTHLPTMAKGLSKTGVASKASAKSILSASVAIVALGAGIALAALGLKILADGAISLAGAGAGAVVVMVGMVAAIGILALVMSRLGVALTAGALGMLAFGVAVLLVGAGIAIAAAGMSLLVGQLPILAEYGLAGAGALLALSGAAALLGVGLLVLGAGALIAALGIAVFGVGALVAAAGVFVLALATAALAASVVPIGEAFQKIGDAIPQIATNALSASEGIMSIGGAGLVAAQGLASFSGSAKSEAKAAENAITKALQNIKNEIAKLKLKLPKIEVGELPHFSISGSFNANAGQVPTISVDWYKSGGVFTDASIIGVGEAGTEAVVPLSSSRMRPFASAISENLNGGNTTNIYVDNARINDDAMIQTSMLEFLNDLFRISKMQGVNRGYN